MLRTLVIKKEFRYSIAFLLLIILFTASDIIIDLNQGLPFDHILHEFLILLLSLVLVIFQLRSGIQKSQRLENAASELKKIYLENEEFKKKVSDHSSAFSQAAEEQFTAWGLTKSERDIAVLLIKGLSMKEIAQLRDSHESTVRQQATGIYKKSKLENRQQLSAFFLEDLF